MEDGGSAQSSQYTGKERKENSPSDLLDDVTDKRSAFAEVTLGARDTGLDNASGGLLYSVQKTQTSQPRCPSSAQEHCVYCRDPPRGETGLLLSTYVALVGADNQARTGGSFLGHFVDGLLVEGRRVVGDVVSVGWERNTQSLVRRGVEVCADERALSVFETSAPGARKLGFAGLSLYIGMYPPG